MRKLVISLLVCFSTSFAFSQEAPVASTATSEASAAAEVATKAKPTVDTQSAAFKVGSWLNGKLTTPVSVGKLFLAGLTQGATKKEPSSEAKTEVSTVTKEVPASAVPVVDIPVAKSAEPDAAPSGLSGISARVATLLAAAKQKQKELNEAHAKSESSVVTVAAQ